MNTEQSKLETEKEQIRKLSDQVKRLTKTESKLYDAQEMLDKQVKIYSELYELGKKLSLTYDLNEILDSAVHFVLYELDFERCLVFMYNDEKLQFTPSSFDGYYEDTQTEVLENIILNKDDEIIKTIIDADFNIIYNTSMENKLLSSFAQKIFLDEYIIYVLGNKTTLFGIMVVGNGLENIDYQTRIEEESYFIVGLNNLVSQITNTINNVNFYNVLEKEKEMLEFKVNKAVLINREKDKQLFKSEKMSSMGEMIGNIAHQWRQPLAAISSTTASISLKAQRNKLDNDTAMELSNRISKYSQHLSNTIDDFRNYIKGDRIKSVFSLSHTIDYFLSLMDSSIKNNYINVISDAEMNIVVNGYENELIQSLINIFNNAKDVLIEKNIEDKLIFISTIIIEDKAVIKIKDNASGIPTDVLPKIFEPYFTTNHQSQGTGLGLHMTYNLIVDGMDGTVGAHNVTYEYNGEEHAGAEFVITLPLN